MKRFTVLMSLLSISILVAWAVVHTSPKSSSAKVSTVPVYDATGAMLKAIHAGDNYKALPVTGVEDRNAPVYDATGAMLKAVHGGDGYQSAPVYDATGAMPAEARP